MVFIRFFRILFHKFDFGKSPAKQQILNRHSLLACQLQLIEIYPAIGSGNGDKCLAIGAHRAWGYRHSALLIVGGKNLR